MIDSPPEADAFTKQVVAELRAPAPSSILNRLGLFVLSLVVFVVVLGLQAKPIDGAILLGVVAVHELGHFLGMRAFGYKDLRVFFVPFFGGAAIGDPSDVSAAKRGLVLLFGPLPGIVAGAVVARFYLDDAIARSVVASLVFVNGLNLLPLEPLDGGQLTSLTLASRQRYVSIGFLLLGTAGLGLLAVKLKSYPLGLVAFLAFQATMIRIRALRASAAFAKASPKMPTRLADADDATLEALVRAVDRAFPTLKRMPIDRRVRAAAGFCREAFERAVNVHPKALASAALLLAQALGLALSVVVLIQIVRSEPLDPRHFIKSSEIAGDGIVVHYPASFVPAVGGHSLFVGGYARGVPISLTVLAMPEGVTTDVIVAGAGKSKARVLGQRTERCHGVDADVVDLESDAGDGTRREHTCVVRRADGRVVVFKSRAPAALYQRVRGDLDALVDAVEIKP